MKTEFKPFLSIPEIAELADYTRQHIWKLALSGELPAKPINPGRSHRRYPTHEMLDWCAAMRAKKMALRKSQRRMSFKHKPNFHSQSVRLCKNLVALFNHHLRRRPLKLWHTEELYDLLSSLKSVTEICEQFELELNSRDDLPAGYRQALAR